MNILEQPKSELHIELADGTLWYPDRDDNTAGIIAIAHALGNLCRFTGHVSRFYSVAEHSVKVSLLVPTVTALMHDAHEAICNDISKPNKLWLEGSYEDLERRCEQQLARQYDLQWPQPREIGFYDKVMCQIEAYYLMPSKGESAGYYSPEVRDRAEELRVVRSDVRPECWSPAEASARFLNRYFDLRGYVL